MAETYQGNYAPELYNEGKRYYLFQAQELANLTDAELRDLHQISNTQLRRFIQEQLGDYCAIRNSYKVAENPSDPTNNFLITGGDGTHSATYYLQGYRLFLESSIDYKSQTSVGPITRDGYTETVLPALTTPAGMSGTLRDVIFDGTSLLVPGSGPALMRTADYGRSWAIQYSPLPSDQTLNAISMGDVNVGFAVGTTGRVVKTTNGGLIWNDISLSLPSLYQNKHFDGVSFVNASVGWIAGENGAILQTVDGGASWTVQGAGVVTTDLRSIDAYNFNRAWAVGTDGTVTHTVDGNAWVMQLAGGSTLNRVQTVDGTYVYAVGVSGKIIKSIDQGLSWTTLTSDVSSDIYGLFFSSRTAGWVAGSGGVVSHTVDGGVTWASKTLDTTSTFYSITFQDTTGFAVGSGGRVYRTLDATNWDRYRTDYVYIDFHLAEVSSDPSMGSEYLDPALKDATVGFPSANRLRAVADVKVSEGWPTPSDYVSDATIQHLTAPLAKLYRPIGLTIIDGTNLTDLRPVVRTVEELSTILGSGDFTAGVPDHSVTPQKLVYTADYTMGSLLVQRDATIQGNLSIQGSLSVTDFTASNNNLVIQDRIQLGTPTHDATFALYGRIDQTQNTNLSAFNLQVGPSVSAPALNLVSSGTGPVIHIERTSDSSKCVIDVTSAGTGYDICVTHGGPAGGVLRATDTGAGATFRVVKDNTAGSVFDVLSTSSAPVLNLVNDSTGGVSIRVDQTSGTVLAAGYVDAAGIRLSSTGASSDLAIRHTGTRGLALDVTSASLDGLAILTGSGGPVLTVTQQSDTPAVSITKDATGLGEALEILNRGQDVGIGLYSLGRGPGILVSHTGDSTQPALDVYVSGLESGPALRVHKSNDMTGVAALLWNQGRSETLQIIADRTDSTASVLQLTNRTLGLDASAVNWRVDRSGTFFTNGDVSSARLAFDATHQMTDSFIWLDYAGLDHSNPGISGRVWAENSLLRISDGSAAMPVGLGSTGLAGATGATGPGGLTGPQGQTGVGAQGIQGPQGATGIAFVTQSLRIGTDTWIDRFVPTAAHGSDSTLTMNGNTLYDKRILIKWDLTNVLPSSVLSDATMVLYGVGINGQNDTFTLHRLTSPWTDAATWNTVDGVTTWSTQGGDYDATALGSVTIPNSATAIPLIGFDYYGLSVIQAMVYGFLPNYGFILVGSSGTNTNYSANSFAQTYGKPTLVLGYVPGGSMGVTGSQGSQGVTGIQGSQGQTGAQGLTGAIGQTGTQGIQGQTGSQGSTGSQGQTGALGATGLQGIQGQTGTQGIQGIQGIQGQTGTQGIQGQTGTQGDTGAIGQTGSQGVTGSQGLTGSQGVQGQTGLQGSTGVAGATGVIGPTGSQGETGVQGVQGDTGVAGETGVQGVQGSTGSQGDTGVTGETGVQGPQGVQGDTGLIGATGVQGIQGDTGLVDLTIYGSSGIFSGVNSLYFAPDSGFGVTSMGGSAVEVFLGSHFKTIAVPGEPSVVASGEDTLTLIPGQYIDLQTDSTAKSVTISVTGMVGSTGAQGPEGPTGVAGVTGIQGETGAGGPGAANVLPLGWPTDGTYAGIFPWTDTVWTADALDQVNDLLLAIAPAPPTALSGTLGGSPTVYSAILPTGLSSAWYQDGRVAGSTLTTYTVTSSFTLTSPSPSTSFKVGSTFGGDTGTVSHVLDGTTYSSRAVTSGTGLTGTINITSLANYGTPSAIWRNGNASIVYSQTSEGYKKHSMTYVVGAITQQTSDSKFWYDGSNPTPVFALAAGLTPNTLSSSRYLSGIRYYAVGDTFDMTASITNIANRAIHPTSPVRYSMQGLTQVSLTIAGASFPYDGTYNFGITDALDLASVYSINAKLDMTATKPNGAVGTSASSLANRLVNTYSTTQSTNGNITMFDENYRFPLSADFSVIPGSITGNWTSSTALTNGNAQLYDSRWTYPTINFTSGYLPAQGGSTNYSTFSGDQVVVWAVNIAVAHSSMSIVFNAGFNITSISAAGAGTLNVEVRLPSETLWLDAGRAFGDSNGCQLGSSNLNNLYLSFGTKTSSNSGGIVFIRVTLRGTGAARASSMVVTGT